MKNERRNGDRYCFNFDLEPKGELSLIYKGRTISVWKLLDISPFGTGLSIDENIALNSQVTLLYSDNEHECRTIATVIWSSKENNEEVGGGFRVGARFNKEQMNLNIAFFKALTNHIME
ncbi:MAG: PilZ domain-containing protein [Mariprofundus sp.]|nr:PilZ domain-containing protein [Mariprofundus sp.]